MRKKILFAPLWGIFALSLLSSCRTEDGAIQQKQIEDKRFAVFVPKDGKVVNYANGFAYLMKRYDNLHKTNLSGVNNKQVIGTLASNDKSTSVSQNGESYVESNIRSQTITEQDDIKWVAFPKVKGNKVVSLVVGILSEKGTRVTYRTFGNDDDLYKQNIILFQAALDRRLKRTSKLTLNASLNPVAVIDPEGCSDPYSVNYDPRCKDIEEVIINIPKPLTKEPNPGNAPSPPPLVIDPDGRCNDYGDCTGGSGNGTGGDADSGDTSDRNPEVWSKHHIDDSGIRDNKCANDVYQKLKTKSKLFKNLLGRFEGASILDLEFKIQDIDTPAKTEIKNVRNGYITVLFNPNYLGSSELGRASMFIHEMLHAYMTWQLKQAGWDGLDNAISYKNIDEKNLPDLLKAYRENLYDAGASEHDFISNFYIPKIVNALKAYDPNLGTDSEYEKIAWAGLQETKAYDNKPNKDTFDSIIWDNIKNKKCGEQ